MPDTINGLPAHPLFVHLVVVLLPLSAIGIIALIAIPQFRGKVQKLFVAAGLAVSVVGAYVTKQSGESLAKVNGVPANHQEWGTRTFYLALALGAISALWFWLDTKPKSVIRTITGILVVLVSLAAITSTVLAGDSGAKAVWEGRASASITLRASSTDTTAGATAITLTAVAQHSTADDCWSAVNGNVYDLTAWISQHPGGSGPIESMCGVDATKAFSNQHGGQSKPENELAKFKVGTLG